VPELAENADENVRMYAFFLVTTVVFPDHPELPELRITVTVY
jgi:hypothetical protein